MPLFLFQEESEVPDDETVNQMLARSEEEFELYQVFTQINYFFHDDSPWQALWSIAAAKGEGASNISISIK